MLKWELCFPNVPRYVLYLSETFVLNNKYVSNMCGIKKQNLSTPRAVNNGAHLHKPSTVMPAKSDSDVRFVYNC